MKKIVIKVGTSTLTQGGQKLSRRYMIELVQQLAALQAMGLEIVLVSSGAITVGRELLSSSKGSSSKQMLASIGQVKLIETWSELFSLFDLQIGQLLLTREDFAERKETTQETLDCLLNNRIIPIINENDPVATEKIKVGDNDNLAALVASLIGADTVILLTDQEGLYTSDPRLDPDAELIPVVKEINEAIFALAGGSSTSLGTGGMATKIEAAQIASGSGIRTIIAPSFHANVLIDLVKEKSIGTLFLGGSSNDND